MTKKLYEEDSYLKSFDAVVSECIPHREQYKIELDRTAFFPEGGGQLPDGGQLNGLPVLDVQEKEGKIYHTVGQPLEVGAAVSGEIDWDLRFSRMQNHSGEHLLSGLIHAKLGYNNVGFHMGREAVTLDVDGVLSREDLEILEEEANRAIVSNAKVSAFYPGREELKAIEYRSKLDSLENIRLVRIEGYDCCACCAPHVARTGEIGILKVLNSYPNKGGTRIEMLCGHDALNDYRLKSRYHAEIMKLLSASSSQTVEAVQRTLQSLAAAKAEIKRLQEKLAIDRLETESVQSVAVGYLQNAGFEELRACCSHLMQSHPEICALFSSMGENSLYLVSAETGDIGPFVSYLKSNLGAKGGGKQNYSQGKIPASLERVKECVRNYAGE